MQMKSIAEFNWISALAGGLLIGVSVAFNREKAIAMSP